MYRLPLLALLILSPLPADVEAALISTSLGDSYQSSGLFIGVGFAGDPDFTNQMAGQRFRTASGGFLTTIEASVERFEGGQDLNVALHESIAGLPGDLLGMITAPENLISTNSFASLSTFDFSSLNISLAADTEYVVTFGVDTPGNAYIGYAAQRAGINSNSFGYGSLFSRDGGGTWEVSSLAPEIGLRVSAIPEPSPAVMILSLVAGAVLWRSCPRGGVRGKPVPQSPFRM